MYNSGLSGPDTLMNNFYNQINWEKHLFIHQLLAMIILTIAWKRIFLFENMNINTRLHCRENWDVRIPQED